MDDTFLDHDTSTTNAQSMNHHHHPNLLRVHATTQPAVNGASHTTAMPEEPSSSTLDHALLESLFYNEMMMLDDSSSASANFLSQSFNEATHPPPPPPPSTGVDPNTIAEKEMLRDFWAAESPMVHAPGKTVAASAARHPPPHPTTALEEPWIPEPTLVTAVAAGAAPTSATPTATTHIPIQPALPPVHTPIAPNVASHHPSMAYASASVPVPQHRNGIKSSLTINTTTPTTHSTAPPAVSEERAKQLVDQFATLASRLGIELPNNVLQSLTVAAVKNEIVSGVESSSSNTQNSPFQATTSLELPPSLVQGRDDTIMTSLPSTAATASNPLSMGYNGSANGPAVPAQQALSSTLVVPPTVEELRRTAEAAIQAVTKKRSPTSHPSSSSNPAPISSFSMETSANHNKDDNHKDDNHNNTQRPLYSKRRKKPRLADCESKLARLKAENERLKRHLQNVSNKAHQLDQEKEEAGRRIQELHASDATQGEMDQAVRQFTDMYADYGIHRQHELTFHLEQLRRLANPTNFTKMGLWTLGQNSNKHNPIAGILQKELDINPQQGRKILEQSQKIRALCENLKECLALLAKLKSLCEQKTRIFQDRMNKCKEILTSKQVVKLILWINEHTLLLETVCPGWGSEHIRRHSLPSSKPA